MRVVTCGCQKREEDRGDKEQKDKGGYQGLIQDLDSRVSKMCFGGDRVSWESNAAHLLRSAALCGRGSGGRSRAPEARGSRCSEMYSLAFPGTYFHYFTY